MSHVGHDGCRAHAVRGCPSSPGPESMISWLESLVGQIQELETKTLCRGIYQAFTIATSHF